MENNGRKKKKIGLIVNPVAGMGGRVGLKGSDGGEILSEARRRGAHPEAPGRTVAALQALIPHKDKLVLLTYPQDMGELECREAGFIPSVIGSIRAGHTTSSDTQKAAAEMADQGVDLLLFAGGDGTARDIVQAIGNRVPVIGIPAGVKIHSGVYAITPQAAGQAVARFLETEGRFTREAEVMDIDEAAFRQGTVTAKLYGYLMVPAETSGMQNVKTGSVTTDADALEGIAEWIVEQMAEGEKVYIIGPGTSTRPIMEALGLKDTLLGVDVVQNGQLLAADAGEAELLELVREHPARIVVTVIGGQGYIFGRGNQQISPQVIRAVGKENIVVIATPGKLAALRGQPLLVDTGDPSLDRELSGYTKVLTGYHEAAMVRVGTGDPG